jgi:hypothetical protein
MCMEEEGLNQEDLLNCLLNIVRGDTDERIIGQVISGQKCLRQVVQALRNNNV